MSHNYLNKSRTQELINTIRGHLSDIATVLSNLASGDARDNTKAPINHNQPSSTITSMTGYSKPQSTSAITANDTLNEAIGKLEAAIDAGGETIPPIVINKVSKVSSTNGVLSGNMTIITIDPNLIENHPIKFRITAGAVNAWGSTYGAQMSYMQTLKFEFGLHGRTMNPITASETITYKTTGYILKTTLEEYDYLSYITDGTSKPQSANYSSRIFELATSVGTSSDVTSYATFENNQLKFFVNSRISQYLVTMIESIEPIDFTAVTSVTHGGVTVWERT